MEGRSRGDRLKHVLELKGEIRMVDIEGAILYGDANKGATDIIEMCC